MSATSCRNCTYSTHSGSFTPDLVCKVAGSPAHADVYRGVRARSSRSLSENAMFDARCLKLAVACSTYVSEAIA